MSRPKLIKKLKDKNPELNQSDLEEILDIFSESIENALMEEKKLNLEDLVLFLLKKIKEKYSAKIKNW